MFKEAREKEDSIIAKIRVGEFDILRDKTRLSEFIDEIYLPYCRLKNPSYTKKKVETDSLKRFFGDIPINQLTPNKIEEFKRKRLSERVRCQKCVFGKHLEAEVCNAPLISPSSVNRELTTLKKLLNVALINRKIKESPMRFVELLPEPAPRDRFLTQREKQKLYEAIKHNRQLFAIVLIALTTGWRKGQILSVKKSDLDKERMAVSIIKSKKSPPRKVPVSNFTFAVFEQLATEAETEYLFFNEKTGKRLGDFKNAWRAVLDRAGIDDFRFHDLRHTVATDMFDLGAGEFMVQTTLGHADIKTTRDYVHIKDPNLRNQLENLANSNKPGGPTIFPPSENMG